MIPVVVFTSSDEESDRLKSDRLGANADVVKPIRYEEFLEALRSIGVFRAVINGVTREVHGVLGACSRFWARWVARKRQQAGRTYPYASRGSLAEQHSRSELLLKGPWLFALPLAPGFLLQPLGFLLTRTCRGAAKPQPKFAAL